MVEDRFVKLANNYAEYFNEVFEKLGFNYGDFQRSMFITVEKNFPKYRQANILDVGCGDGETLQPFVDVGCINLTGIDLNPEMLEVAKKRFGKKAKLLQADATDLSMFKKGDFDIVLTGACIHNIPTKDRVKFWKELNRISPKIFVAGEKIADPDPKRHNKYYKNEVNSIIEVYNSHKLPEVAEEWVKHYECDEEEKMTLLEIQKAIGQKYNLSVVAEFGMYKTVVAIRKEDTK